MRKSGKDRSMKRLYATVWIGLGVLALLALTVYSFANAPEAGSMGVWGYVASGEDAQLDLEDQPATRELVVAGVAAPAPAWIVVHANDEGMPGERVGLVPIPRGRSADVKVPLSDGVRDSVIVAVHADRGTQGRFDFDMDMPAESADRPLFVDRMELAGTVRLQ
jgi:hypothetical protein